MPIANPIYDVIWHGLGWINLFDRGIICYLSANN